MIALDFDPFARFGDVAVRWQTIGVTGALLVALVIALLTLPRDPRRGTAGRRLDDLILVAAGIVPGAVLGGRLVHGLVYLDIYLSDPYRLLDPSSGSLSLLGAVLGGIVTGLYAARLVGAPLRRWADTAAVPMLLAIGLGKLAMLLGGSGQGLPFDASWAVAFTGPGPWVSANPELPSHPAQLYEGLWLLAWVPVVLLTRRRSAPGAAIVIAVLAFLLGRVLVGFFWRDEDVVAPWNAEQILALITLAALGSAVIVRSRRRT